MRRLISSVILLLPLLASPAIATLIVVPDEAPTIQFAILAAASGDSVMVRAGTYAESLTMTGIDLTIFGESGATATVITGSSSSRILEVVGPNVTTATAVQDLTFRDGKATQGAGIHLSSGASLTLRRCRFLQNQALGTGGIVAGGAVFLDAGSTLQAEDCFFQDNRAAYTNLSGDASGGAIEGRSGAQIEIRRSEFIHNTTSGFEGGLGGGINVHGSALVEDCRFNEGFGSEGAGIRAGNSGAELVVRRCVFDQNWASLFGAAGIHCVAAVMTLENNVFFLNSGPAVVAIQSRGAIANNTIYFNGIGIELQIFNQVQPIVTNNIISSNGSSGVDVFGTPAPGSFACNDVWANQGDNYSGIPDPTGTNGNISADPLFCNEPARDFTLNGSSPCVPPNSPPGCGLIGALPLGCGVADVADSPPSANMYLAVMPNPVRGVARFQMSETAPFTTLHILDSQGRLVERLLRQDGHWEWAPGGTVPAGVYFARPEVGLVDAPAVKFLYLR